MSRDNVELIWRGYKAFTEGDFEAMFSLLDPDVEWQGIEEGPWDLRDRENVMAVLGERLAENATLELEECLDAGDQVVVTFRAAGLAPPHRVEDENGRYFAVGRYFTVGRYYAVITIQDGKVVRVQDFSRRADALEAAGLEEVT